MEWKLRRYCGSLNETMIGASVQCSGWVDTIRDHGPLLFMHLRDISGVVQVVFDATQNPDIYALGKSLHNEYAVTVDATVVERSNTAKNTSLPTGCIELHVNKLTLHSTSGTPPFVITEKSLVDDESKNFNVDEDLRLKYRYLDLRRPSMQKHLKTRYELVKTMRRHLDDSGFIDIETPVLTKSTPEGARDYLVPSRTQEGAFYALPQSPQLFKQLLMVSGFDRYYQVVRCFRDEDLRPNRQPEFTQLDLEASFIDETFIYHLMEGLVTKLYQVVGKTVVGPFPHITYDDAISMYGNDRPELRFGSTMVDVTPLLKATEYKIFNTIANSNGLIKAINIKGKADVMSKSMLQEELAKKVVPQFGGKGMSWMKLENGELISNIVQFFSESEKTAIREALQVEEGDVLLFIADTNHALVNDCLGRLRLYLGEKLGLIDPNAVAACWVTEFPLFELKDGALTSTHHPFTSPDRDILSLNTPEELVKVKSRAYDLVINGEEVGGGSIRIHRSDIQQKIFDILGLTPEDIQIKFGFFVNALTYGAPPHGGIALGVDRLVSKIIGVDSIREIIAFPKNRVAHCPLTLAPDKVSASQLEELNIKTVLKNPSL